MTATEELLLKCVESLMTVASTAAVILDYEGKVRPEEAKTLNRAFSAYSSAHYDLLHPKTKEDESARRV